MLDYEGISRESQTARRYDGRRRWRFLRIWIRERLLDGLDWCCCYWCFSRGGIMRRFTIMNLMGLVVVLAVGLASIRGANDYWASGFILATPLFFGLTLIAALCGAQ